MADSENKEVSSKEEETAKQDEKDKDTTNEGLKTPGESSRQKSARSGSAKGKSSPEKSSSKGKKPAKGKAKKEEATQPTPAPADEENNDGLPDGTVALFLSSKTQELFECIADEQVTVETPNKLIPKEAIIQDMKTRAAVSDFTPVKQQMQEYTGEEVLVIYDADFKFGQNFYIALTEEAKEKILKPPVPEGEEGGEGGEGGGGVEEEEEDIIYTYVPPEPKEWVSLGSEVEIEDEAVTESRQKLTFTIQRIRREFGAPVKFSDHGPDDIKDGYIECVSFEDKSFNIKKMELDTSTQAVGTYTEKGTQTDWKHPCNKFTQYAPRLYEEEERKKLAESTDMLNFINQVTPRFELALQQNEIMDVFFDDWKALADEDSTFGSKSDNHLKEYQSFTDLLFSKDKTLTCIEWHPTIKGVIAVSCSERVSFDDRVDNASKILMNPSLILLWSFHDPIHPQILLEAPDDIFCFKFNPSDPNIITGGCINGQVVMWDISKYSDRLRNNQRGKQAKKNTMSSLPGFEDENTDKTPVVRYCAVSSIEHSHKSAICDIQWVPDHMEVTRGGVIVESKTMTCTQILSASVDGTVGIWDTKPPKGQTPSVEDARQDNPLGVPTTFKHLDLTWKPTLKIPVFRVEGSGEYGVTRISIQERQGDRGAVEKLKTGDMERKESSVGHMGGSLRMGSAKDKKPLEGATTKFFVGTEDGELVYADWKLEKDADSGKIQPPRPQFCKLLHHRSINTLQRSPFYKDIILVVGGWNFTIWKEGHDTAPLLQSAAAKMRLTAGYWSPTRPAVFFIGTADGNVDVWDLLDRTHEPSLSQNVSASAITNIFPWDVSNKQQLLAVSDSVGTLHILEVPWTLRHCSAGELPSVTNYLDREVKRLEYIDNRQSFHVDNKRKMQAEEAEKKMAQPTEPNTEEMENKMKVEWIEFQEDEKKFLEELGLLVVPDEPLPDV
ncbi:dynein axonemal intermediate chain 3-like isoform X2 [Amphiura filiformis]|uniref:dynein axonemal intermediate chain 3-like isoform X2 n=1 Tax=Amphiura filiformis TaxID=82378 RepID=UPI003B20F603